jgi:outer membrane protein OmpA-like peptidoglycan-associated protein
MNGRALIALAVSFPLFGALAGVATADSLFPNGETGLQQEEQLAPASVTITLHTSDLAHSIAYVEDGTSFTIPVYFGLDDTSITDEANLALIALADEASVAQSVSITVSAHGLGLDEGATLQDMRALTVFDRLNELGIPDRAMALELNQGPGANADILTDVNGTAI